MISGEVGRNEKEMIFRFRRIRKHFEWGLGGLGGGRCAYLVSNDKLSSVSGPRLMVAADTLVYSHFSTRYIHSYLSSIVVLSFEGKVGINFKVWNHLRYEFLTSWLSLQRFPSYHPIPSTLAFEHLSLYIQNQWALWLQCQHWRLNHFTSENLFAGPWETVVCYCMNIVWKTLINFTK